MWSIVSSSKASINLVVYGHLIPGMQSEVLEFTDELVMPVAFRLIKKQVKLRNLAACYRLQQI